VKGSGSAISKDADHNSANGPGKGGCGYTISIGPVRGDTGEDDRKENGELTHVSTNRLAKPIGVEDINDLVLIRHGEGHHGLL
jgi:hypothetical protein